MIKRPYLKHDYIPWLIGLAAFFLCLIVLFEIPEGNEQQDLYCEMVTTYQETKGDYGWPDYQNNYNEVCK